MEQLSKSPPPFEPRGEGVFATRAIKKGEMLERSPVIPVSATDWAAVSQTVLRHYVYAWGEKGEDVALALGYASLFRSLPAKPSASYVKYLEEMVIVFFASGDIARGEEITVDRGTFSTTHHHNK